jgi:dihydrodipicolinate synthase/N-acetylneuraminate lyase
LWVSQFVESLLVVAADIDFFKLASKGRYDAAMARMEEIDPSILRILKHYQYWAVFAGLLKLKKELHRYTASLPFLNLIYAANEAILAQERFASRRELAISAPSARHDRA